jgi:hypothetical protein
LLLDGGAEHPNGEHIAENMPKVGMKEHIGERLPPMKRLSRKIMQSADRIQIPNAPLQNQCKEINKNVGT